MSLTFKDGGSMALVPLEELEKSGANPYEVALAAAKEARRLNEIRWLKLMQGITEGEEIREKVTTLALRRIAEGKAKVAYRGKDVGG